MTSSLPSYIPFLGAGEFSDLFLEESKSLTLRWDQGRIEAFSSAEDSGAGLRNVNQFETRFGHVNLGHPLSQNLTKAELMSLAQLKNKLSFGLKLISLSAVKPLQHHQHKILIDPQTVPLDQKIHLLETIFKACQCGPEIRQVNVNYGEKIKKIAYLNSEGACFTEDRVYGVLSVRVTAEKKGDRQNAYESMGGINGFELFQKDLTPWAQSVADRALQKLAAPQAPVGEMPVVISSAAGGTLIHEAVGHSLEADAVLEGTSPAYKNKLNQKVANEKLTVFDDPTVSKKRGSFFVDDEGVPSEASKLIEGGVLKDYMFDRLSAKRAGRASNGHGRRESYAHRPIPRMSNTFIAPGPDKPDEILTNFKKGLLVTRMGGGQVNTANGDFVFEVEEGFQVENGKKKMVRGATLLGNGPQVLLDIDQVGSDHGWGIGTCGKEGQGVPVSDAIPTIHIRKMVIGGQN